MAREHIILVDRNDREIGIAEKLKAHREGKLHRAFSVFLFNSKNEMLLQQRAAGKYHSAGLWSNTCCSHPRPGEPVEAAAKRRRHEEMGITSPLEKAFDFIYRAEFACGLIEHELDHVFIGRYDGVVRPAAGEVMAYRWEHVERAGNELQSTPKKFTVWFGMALERLIQFLRQKNGLVAQVPGLYL
jgi:isopentenyl-diphosphate delta-isomerase